MAKRSTAPKASAPPAAEQKTASPKKPAEPAGKKPGPRGGAANATAAKRKVPGSKGGLTAPSHLDLELMEIITVVGPGVAVIEVHEERNLAETAEEISQTEQLDFDTAGPDAHPGPLESRGTGPEAY